MYSLSCLYILFDENNITSIIRGKEITVLSSQLSQKSEVREQLMQIQKQYRKLPGLVAEGRDMSSKLFPDSKVTHFNNLHEKSGIPFKEMIFFDDEPRNTIEVGYLGVHCSLIKSGINMNDFESLFYG